jgi:hypothetical protein
MGWLGYGVAGAYGSPFAAAPTQEQQLDALRSQADSLQQALEGIRARIGQVEADSGQKAEQ